MCQVGCTVRVAERGGRGATAAVSLGRMYDDAEGRDAGCQAVNGAGRGLGQ